MGYLISDCGWNEKHMTHPPLFTNKTYNHTLKYVFPNRRTTHFIKVVSVCKSVATSVFFSSPESLKPLQDNTLKFLFHVIQICCTQGQVGENHTCKYIYQLENYFKVH